MKPPRLTGVGRLSIISMRLAKAPHRRRERRASTSRNRDAGAAVERRDQSASAVSGQLSHAVEPNQRAPMGADETVFTHALFQRLKRLAQEVTARTDP